MALAGEPAYWRELLWQDDVISRAQLAEYGVTDAMIRARVAAGKWQRLLPGTYLTHGGPIDYMSRVWAGVLHAGAGAVASHDSAANLLGLVDRSPNVVHVLVPYSRRPRSLPGLVVHRSSVPFAVGTGRPPRTNAESTVLDLVTTMSDEGEVVGLVTRALASGVAHPVRLADELARRGRVRWRKLITEIVIEGHGVESTLEWRYRRDVERPHGLPKPRRQDVVRTSVASVRRDVYYEEQRVVVELDGRLGHAGVGAFRDASRDNAAAMRGDITLRYGWVDVVTSPCQVAWQVATVLTSRGWPGAARPCGPTCRLARSAG